MPLLAELAGGGVQPVAVQRHDCAVIALDELPAGSGCTYTDTVEIRDVPPDSLVLDLSGAGCPSSPRPLGSWVELPSGSSCHYRATARASSGAIVYQASQAMEAADRDRCAGSVGALEAPAGSGCWHYDRATSSTDIAPLHDGDLLTAVSTGHCTPTAVTPPLLPAPTYAPVAPTYTPGS